MLRDHGANIVKGVNDAGLPSLGCFLHTLHLIITDAISCQQGINNMIARCRRIVGHFAHSSSATEKLHAMQRQMQTPEHQLEQDVKTRWNSTYYMLERLFEQRQVLGSLATVVTFEGLSANDWNLVGVVLSLLKPFEEVTKIISKDECIISEIIPATAVLIRFLEKEDSAHNGALTFKKKLLESAKKRFQEYTDDENCYIATALDPRFKDDFFGDDDINLIKEKIVAKVAEGFVVLSVSQADLATSLTGSVGCSSLSTNFDDVVTTSGHCDSDISICTTTQSSSNANVHGPPTITTYTHQSFWSGYEEIRNNRRQPLQQTSSPLENQKKIVEAELNAFWRMSVIPMTTKVENDRETRTNPLLWWKANCLTFPHLSKQIFKYLCGLPSSVYSERLFSQAGRLYEDDRNRLLPEVADKLLFLKYNLPGINFSY